MLVALSAIAPVQAQQAATELSRETFDPFYLPSPGLLRLGAAAPTFVDTALVEGQVFLSIPVRHAISGMSSAGRYVDVVYRRGRPRGRPDRPSRVLPEPAPFYLTMLSDEESGAPQYWWCTPGEGLRAGSMCTGGGLDSGVVTGRSSVGSLMIENHGNPFMATSLRYRTCVSGCSTAWMHHFTLEPNNEPVRAGLTLDYVLGPLGADRSRTIERRLGGRAFDSEQVQNGAELRTVAGVITFTHDGGGVRAIMRPYSQSERARSLVAFGVLFSRLLATRHPLMRGEPGMVAAADDPTGVAADAPVSPMTQVFSQRVTLPGNDMPFPPDESPEFFIDYVGGVGDAWDATHGEFRPRYAWFVFGYARFSGGRWYALVPLDGSASGTLTLAGQPLLRVTEIDDDGVARIEMTGSVPSDPTAVR